MKSLTEIIFSAKFEKLVWFIMLHTFTTLIGLYLVALTYTRPPLSTYLVTPAEGYFFGGLFIAMGISLSIIMVFIDND